MSDSVLVITDLDGSLLDHYTYSYEAAQPMIDRLKRDGIPLVLCSSKTRAEMQQLRAELDLDDPYIVENGAAIYLPKTACPDAPEGAESVDDEWRVAFGRPRAHWGSLLQRLPDELRCAYRSFGSLTVGQIADMTGLSMEGARLAAQREFGEPLQWRGNVEEKQQLMARLEQLGARVLEGGRFLHVVGDWDKGRALQWLAAHMAKTTGQRPITIALGDSHNDVAMLEAADSAIVIRSPVHPAPTLSRAEPALLTEATGPRGWAQGLSQTLDQLAGDAR